MMNSRMASSREFRKELLEEFGKVKSMMNSLPEFVTQDLPEGILVGLGLGVPIAMMPNQDLNEQAGTVLGAITAATLGGAASKRIGAAIGNRIHPSALQPGTFAYNTGRGMGRKAPATEIMEDVLSDQPPRITGEEVGRAWGRMVGDEAFGIAGALGGLAAGQALNGAPDDPQAPQPTIGQAALGTIPGAITSLALSGLTGGLFDGVGFMRDYIKAMENPGSLDIEALKRNVTFLRNNARRPTA